MRWNESSGAIERFLSDLPACVSPVLFAPSRGSCRPTDVTERPKYEEFRPRTNWSLSNMFTYAFEATISPTMRNNGSEIVCCSQS